MNKWAVYTKTEGVIKVNIIVKNDKEDIYTPILVSANGLSSSGCYPTQCNTCPTDLPRIGIGYQ